MIHLRLFSKDSRLLSVLSSTLGRDFTISLTSTLQHAYILAQTEAVDVWLIDADPDFDLADDWRKLAEDAYFAHGVPVILMTTDENRHAVLHSVESTGHDWVRKPPAVRELKYRLKTAYDAHVLKEELQRARHSLEVATGLDQIIGSSVPMLNLYNLIRRVANLDASVLVTGESGTGKELVARAIHNLGRRANRPFVALSCGAIPETLIESELFGHERGAFTGTAGAREGYLEKAGDGTLFFDEIGELSHNTQVKLLRVLQQKEFMRLGSSRPIPLRARIVFATHRNLGALVANGTFRQDLFYRVNIMNLHVPALRDHASDISMLVRHFLQRYAESYGKPVDGIEPEALALLQNYAWPGNVRELENAVQNAIIMAEDNVIRTENLPATIQDQDLGDDESDLTQGSFERLLRDYKLKLVRDAITQANGNKTLAAQSLSISRAYLHRLIRPLGAPEELCVHLMASENEPEPTRLSMKSAS